MVLTWAWPLRVMTASRDWKMHLLSEPSRAGLYWEVTAVPDLRRKAADLATRLASQL